MGEILFNYQADPVNYVKSAISVYSFMAERVKLHTGGFKGKVVLEIGSGFQLPHGGLNLVLALREGAEQCFGIDITHPCDVCARPDRVEFWKTAVEYLGMIAPGGLKNDGRVRFSSTDVLWFDNFYSTITLLQMSASKMYFKNDMFDLIISNAVMEHVKNPKNVLSEIYRVLDWGGFAYLQWNPFSGFEMGGHDLGMPFYFPWAHLRLSENEHIEKLGFVFSNEAAYTTAFPEAHTSTAERAREYAKDPGKFRNEILTDLNKMRIKELKSYAEECGFEIIYEEYFIKDDHRKYLTESIRKELCDYTEDELLAQLHAIVLKKIKCG
jgi:ubiquinone/menaquinone biosynthesis C-methylase UbiE